MKKMITRRQFMAAAGVVAAASALTACGGSSASTAASSAAGSTAGSAAASGSTIKVGVLGPMTGDASVYGLAVINGASLYMKQVNADGGVNGKQLEIITMDEQGDATQAVTCFTKMVDQGITALVGDVTTPRRWLSPLRAPITICPWSPLPLLPRLLPTMPRPTP